MKFISANEESRLQVIEDLSQFLRRRKVEKLLSQVQLVIGSVQPIFIKRKILGNRSSSQLISADARESGRSIGEHTDHLRLHFRFSAPLSFRFVFDIIFETNVIR